MTNGLAHLITAWHDHMRGGDENLTTALALVPPALGRPAMAVLRCCYASADAAAATAALAPFRLLAPVAADEISVVPYAAVLDEATMPPGTRADGHPDSETRSHPFTHVLDEELLVGREPLRLKAR